MLLVHGWGVSGELFRDQLENLSDRFRVIAPDLPGHGSSGHFSDEASFSDLADSIVELIQELGLDSICLVGWSLGALVVWDLMDRYPELPISSMATIDMVPRLLNGDDWIYGLRDGSDYHAFDRDIEIMLDNWPAYAELLATRLVEPMTEQTLPDLLPWIRRIVLANDPRSMATIWKRMVEQDLRHVLPEITQPVLVIAGAKSKLYGIPAGEWVAGQMYAARLEVFADSGHAPQLDEPLRFNQLLEEFISTCITHTTGHTGNQKA